jgi:oligogalacturonide lyase
MQKLTSLIAFYLGLTVGLQAADAPTTPVTSPPVAASTVSNDTTTATASATTQPDVLPKEWIDADTGHRIVRLSEEDNTQSLYFHQNPYTPDGQKLVVTTPDGIATINLKTREIKKVTLGDVPSARMDQHDTTPADTRLSHIVVGKKTPTAFYLKGADIMATNLDTGVSRKIGTLPEELRWGAGFTVNADETLLAGAGNAEPGPMGAIGPAWAGNQGLPQRLRALVPMVLYTVDIKTGEVKKFFHAEHDWLNHVQFSPTDPTLLMYCHEGPWDQVDRIWQIRVNGSGEPKLLHQRTMNMEIAGHEFWAADGKSAWYDLQTPKSQVFWLAGEDLATGQRTRYSLPMNEWSVHYNISPDGKLFAGDGGGPNSVARGNNGQWIYLFTPDASKEETLEVGGEKVKVDQFKAERLASLAKHDYTLEPNVSFTPDMKWIVFRSNLLGAAHGSHVFAVEIAKPDAKTNNEQSQIPAKP